MSTTKKIELTVTISGLDQWSVDWDNVDQVEEELLILRSNVRHALHVGAGLDVNDMEIQFELIDP